MSYQLETRTCLCGCARSFRVLPTDTTTYFARYEHAYFCRNRKDAAGRLARAIVKRRLATKQTVNCGRPSREARIKRAAYYLAQSDLDDFLEPRDADD